MMKSVIASATIAATILTAAVPAQAASLPDVFRSNSVDAPMIGEMGWTIENEQADRHRRYRGWRHRRGIDGGDILAGALIIGGIAAIAGAANNQNRLPRDGRPPFRADDDVRAAVAQCGDAAAIQSGRGARVERIDGVARDGNGWRVDGVISSRDGFDPFICGITYGRIDYVQFTRNNAGPDRNFDPSFDDNRGANPDDNFDPDFGQ